MMSMRISGGSERSGEVVTWGPGANMVDVAVCAWGVDWESG